MKNKIKIGLLSVMLSGFFFTACESYPGEDDYVKDQLVAFTTYDTSVTFKGTGQKFTSYSLGEGLIYVYDYDTTFIYWDDSAHPEVGKLKVQIEKAMADYLGYTEKAAGPGPVDLGIYISVVKRDNYIVDYNPWWWDCSYYYYWWWDCGSWYPPYYPYPYPVIIGSYTTGTTFINMIDLTNKWTQEQKPVVWTGAIRSLMTGTQSDTDFNNAINDCFKQTKAFQ